MQELKVTCKKSIKLGRIYPRILKIV